MAGAEHAAHNAAGLDQSAAHELAAQIGFLLVPGDPVKQQRAYLLVALRPAPTYDHFDPELVTYWTHGPSPAQDEIRWLSADTESGYSWGVIRVIDRILAENRFLSFGGQLTISRRGGLRTALFASDAPIFDLGGHSGPANPIGVNAASFFGLLRAACGADHRVAQIVADARPTALYAAFVTWAVTNTDARDQMVLVERALRAQSAADHAEGVRLARLI